MKKEEGRGKGKEEGEERKGEEGSWGGVVRGGG